MEVRKVLLLSATPQNTDPLRVNAEFREIRDCLQVSTQRDRFTITERGALRIDDLQQVLRQEAPHIVHFSGHGAGQKGLVLETDAGAWELVRTEPLAALFQLLRQALPDRLVCVVLNACYSELQAIAIHGAVPYVIGMGDAIGDSAAIEFAKGFYSELFAGGDIARAFDFGKNRIDLKNIPEGGKPQILSSLESKNYASKIVTINDRHYVLRLEAENRGKKEVLRPGALIRIKSPEKMGKTFLMGRVLDFASQKGYRVASIDLREVNQQILMDINQFLQWLCAYLCDRLGLDIDVEQQWKKILGPNPNCTRFLEKFLLQEESPLVLAFDNFDCIFDHRNIEIDFCGLLRGWYEKVNTNPTWGKLRQIIVYSQESYVTHDINQSPLNVGVPIELEDLTIAEIEALAAAYNVAWSKRETAYLMEMIGGNPFLVLECLENLSRKGNDLESLLRNAATEAGIYGNFLRDRWQLIEENPDLREALKQVVQGSEPVRLSSREAFKLDSMGLIRRQNNDVMVRCPLYRLYFQNRLL